MLLGCISFLHVLAHAQLQTQTQTCIDTWKLIFLFQVPENIIRSP
jgi:hypothetical protein